MVRRWSLTGHFLILYYPPHAAEDVQRVGCLLSIATEGKSVAQLSWSGHAGRAHLATAGADGSVRVWALLGGGGSGRGGGAAGGGWGWRQPNSHAAG
jgi:hypothetical protein